MVRELQGQALLSEGRVRINAIKSFLAYVDGLVLRARQEAFTFAKALSLSMDIEKSLVEKGMLDHFHATSPEVNALLDRLKRETKAHVVLIEDMWKRNLSPGKG